MKTEALPSSRSMSQRRTPYKRIRRLPRLEDLMEIFVTILELSEYWDYSIWFFLFLPFLIFLVSSNLFRSNLHLSQEAGTSSSFQPSSASKCFLHNVRPCKQGEGIGGLFRRMEWILAIAAKFGCSYVCNVDDWPTGVEKNRMPKKSMVKHRWNNGETLVKQGWNKGETMVKQGWNKGETMVKQGWNTGETRVKQWWNKGETMVGCITFLFWGGWGGMSPCQLRVVYIFCINSLPWGHGTGKVGHLFGCERDRVIGHPSKIVAQTAIKGLKLGFRGIWMTFLVCFMCKVDVLLYIRCESLSIYIHVLNLFVQRENMRKPACHIEKYHDIRIFSATSTEYWSKSQLQGGFVWCPPFRLRKSARTRLTYKKSSPYVVRYKKGQPLLRSSAWTLEARPKAEARWVHLFRFHWDGIVHRKPIVWWKKFCNHLGLRICIKPCKKWDKRPTSTAAGFLPSTVWQPMAVNIPDEVWRLYQNHVWKCWCVGMLVIYIILYWHLYHRLWDRIVVSWAVWCVYMVDYGCMFLSSSLADCLSLNMDCPRFAPAFAAFSGSEWMDSGFWCSSQVWEFKPDCKEMMTVTHETTWKWIQGQYNAVRLAKRRDENTAWGIWVLVSRKPWKKYKIGFHHQTAFWQIVVFDLQRPRGLCVDDLAFNCLVSTWCKHPEVPVAFA